MCHISSHACSDDGIGVAQSETVADKSVSLCDCRRPLTKTTKSQRVTTKTLAQCSVHTPSQRVTTKTVVRCSVHTGRSSAPPIKHSHCLRFDQTTMITRVCVDVDRRSAVGRPVRLAVQCGSPARTHHSSDNHSLALVHCRLSYFIINYFISYFTAHTHAPTHSRMHARAHHIASHRAHTHVHLNDYSKLCITYN